MFDHMPCVDSEDHWSGDRLGNSAPVSWIKNLELVTCHLLGGF